VDNNSKVTQAPTLLTLDDREATIFVGEKVPFITQQSTIDQNGNATITLTESSKSPQQVGFTLFITPHIVRETDQVIMTIIPRVTRLTGGVPGAGGLVRFTTKIPTQFGLAESFIDLPRIADQTVVTKLLVRNQTTAVIGGLMSETVTEVEQRIPIISSIPLIGSLFKFTSNDYTQENLIIFVTPRIIKSADDSSELFTRQYQIFQENDFFYLKYLKKDADEEDEGKPKRKKRTQAAATQAPAGEPLGAEGDTPPPAPGSEGVPPAPPKADGSSEAPPPPAAPAPAPAGSSGGSGEAPPPPAAPAPAPAAPASGEGGGATPPPASAPAGDAPPPPAAPAPGSGQ
jgi:general secretion pathway protein D